MECLFWFGTTSFSLAPMWVADTQSPSPNREQPRKSDCIDTLPPHAMAVDQDEVLKLGRSHSVVIRKAKTSPENIESKPHTSSCSDRQGRPENYVFFRTRSSKFNPGIEKQLSRLREQEEDNSTVADEPPASHRYFDALHGPELEQLKDSEDTLLPLDEQWPFLLRFPISSFGITLGLGSQSILWKQLANTASMRFLHVTSVINKLLWCLGFVMWIMVFFIYIFKCVFYWEAVRREYYHPVRVNFFFAPCIAGMFLTIGLPWDVKIHPWVWCVLMAPVICLELKIYGQWLSGGERRLSRIANPSTHLSVVGNFVGAILGASVGWKEAALFFWAVGLAHYMVLFVTLYQRLPTNEVLPKDLHPVFFLFVAAPSSASVAWEKITGKFDMVSRIVYFVALFLLTSLVVRLNFFRGFRFSLAWWAYTFPMTAASIASIRYSQEVRSFVPQALAFVLSLTSSLTVFFLFMTTVCQLLRGTLLPNDQAIAITQKHVESKFTAKAEGEVMNGVQHCNPYIIRTCFGSTQDV